MRLSPECANFKIEFGKYIKSERKLLGIGSHNMSDVLGLSYAVVAQWERGYTFPRSTMNFKKLNVLYSDLVYVVAELLTKRGIAPTQKEWDTFIKTLENTKDNKHYDTSKPACQPNYIYKDEREQLCRYYFGKFLREERTKRGIERHNLAKALNLSIANMAQLESGLLFPTNIKTLVLLDKLYDGKAIKVIFGLCEKYGVKLTQEEIKTLVCKLNYYIN